MILNTFHKIIPNSLIFTYKNNIVIGYKKRRSIFDLTNYNPEWVPRQSPYSKFRKPPQTAWTD